MLFDKSSGILVFLKNSVTLDEVQCLHICINISAMQLLAYALVSQFSTAQEELLRLLNDYIKILDNKALPYAQDVKV